MDISLILNIIVQTLFVKHRLFFFNWIILVTHGGWEYLRLLVSYDIQTRNTVSNVH